MKIKIIISTKKIRSGLSKGDDFIFNQQRVKIKIENKIIIELKDVKCIEIYYVFQTDIIFSNNIVMAVIKFLETI